MTTLARKGAALAVLAALLLAAPAARAAAPKTVGGAWKVRSVTQGGKPGGFAPGTIFAEGALWHLKKGGKATVGGWDWEWSYGPDDGELALRRWGLLRDSVFKARVKKTGADLTLCWDDWLFGRVEMVLTPDD